MIRSVTIHDVAKTPIRWAAKVPRLRSPEPIVFQPGLNILWGANGSGKSTLLHLLARVFHCEAGVDPVVTTSSLRALFGPAMDAGELAVTVDHDGQGVRFFDPTHAVGLDHGYFDDDFFLEGVANAVFKASSGQTTMARFNGIIADVLHGKVPDVRWTVTTEGLDTWSKRALRAQEILAGIGEKGPPTLLLDEPDRSLDLRHQLNLWRFLRAAARTTQVIVAAHTVFALDLPDAHVVEMDDSLTRSQRVFGILKGAWADETPSLDALRAKMPRTPTP